MDSDCTVDFSAKLAMNGQYIRWLLKHADKLPALSAAFSRILDAVDLTGRWEGVKAIGDILVGMLADFPAFASAVAFTAEEWTGAAATFDAAGFDLGKLLAFLEFVLPLIKSLLDGFKK